MDRTPRLLLLSVTLLALRWRGAAFAPTRGPLDLSTLTDLTNLLRLETDRLLDQYTRYHGIEPGAATSDAPESSVNGTDIDEQLLDIHLKNARFVQHLADVTENQQRWWRDPASVAAPLSKVRLRLRHQSAEVQTLLRNASLPAPEPVQRSSNHSYRAKVYGLGVIVRLKEWLARVSLVLREAEGPGPASG